MSYIIGLPYRPDDTPRLTHEDRQYLAHKHRLIMGPVKGGWVRISVSQQGFETVTAEMLEPLLGDPTVAKLSKHLVLQKLKG